jgi:hypothetical protein
VIIEDQALAGAKAAIDRFDRIDILLPDLGVQNLKLWTPVARWGTT